ncbi:MAG: hypothetical protein LUD77_11000 [Clostridiales bacterium]|nr:hypothetical protein [Clostridiales bacterium]
MVTATGGSTRARLVTGGSGAGIGGGYDGSSSGSASDSDMKIYNSSVKASSISVTPTNADGKDVYLYTIPNTTEGDSLIVDGKTYIESIVHHTSNDSNQYIYLTEDSEYAVSGSVIYSLSYSNGTTSVQTVQELNEQVLQGLNSINDYISLSLNTYYENLISYHVDNDGYIYADVTLAEGVYTAKLEEAADITNLEIPNAAVLCLFADIVNSGNTTINGTVTANIDLTDTGWTPIGNSSNKYSGTFDGGGYVVSNLYYNDSSMNYVGLFGYIYGGTVKNTGIENCYIYGRRYVGGICGYNDGGTVSNCYSTGSVSGSSDNIGGICGYSNYSSSIANCRNEGDISGDYYSGGICGYNSSGSISSCYNIGSVISSNNNSGGICGINYSTISYSYNTGSISGGTYTGGICGRNYEGSVSFCYNTGSVNGDTYTGGICGDDRDGTVSSCYYLSGTAEGGIDSSDVSSSAEAKTADEFAGGEVTYLLNGSSNDSDSINFYQNIDNGETADTYPVLDDNHGTVYYIEAYYYCPDSYISVYSNTEDSGNSTSHTYVNNICEYCGDVDRDSISTDEDGNYIYEISNADQLAAFAAIVNAGNTGLYGVVKNDIDLSSIDNWTPIGTEAYPYLGIFDGGGYTISNMTITASSGCSGLFGYIGDSSSTGVTVKNFTVSGNITLSGECKYIGGVVGKISKRTIENVVSEVNINISNIENMDDGSTDKAIYVGGVVGYATLARAAVNKCVYKGEINLTDSSDQIYIGGIAGTFNGTSTVTYCYNLGSISASDSSSSYVGGILGLLSSSNFNNLSYCYDYGNLSADASENCGAIIGLFGGASSATISNNYWLDTSSDYAFGTNNSTFDAPDSSTVDEFASGEIAYLLNGSSSENLTWYQTIGSDSYPVFDDTHGAVYYVTDYYYCPDYFETLNTYKNDTGNTETHTYEGESCKYCGQDVAEGSLNKDDSGNYIISTVEELAAFANLVNTGFTSVKGIVTADIDFTDYTDTMIGSTDYPYSGTLDGGGYTITLNYNSSETNAALISYASGATIKNLNTAGTITTSAKFAGGILGQTASSTSAFTTISGCSSSVSIVSTVDGDGTHGGITGALNASYDVVENCYFNGSITGSSTTNCAGIVGWLTVATISVENCYVSAEYSLSSSDSGSYNIARGRTSGVSNCYYLNAICSSASDGTQKTADEFAGGEATYLLNGSVSGGTTWYQNIDSGTADSFPVLDSSHSQVYTTSLIYCPDYSEIGGYSNTEGITAVAEEGSSTEHSSTEHSYVNGVCKYCGAIDSSSSETDENGNYIISTAYQLAVFAATVNSGSTNINGIVTADIDFTDYTTTMIDSSSYPYAGTFDSGGYTITVSYEATGTGDIGLFSYVTGGMVKNLVVEGNIDFTDAPQGDDSDGGYAHVGGAIGILTGSGGTASNIVSRVNIITPEDNAYPLHQAAGVVGSLQADASVDKCIYEGTITVYKSYDCIGGIVGYSTSYCTITNCANLGTVYASGTGNTTITPYVGGILGYINSYDFSSLKNCYNYGTVSANDDTYCGAVVGMVKKVSAGVISNNFWLEGSAPKYFNNDTYNTDNTDAASSTADQFTGGEIAYLLNSEDESGVWVQTIGTDKYPLFTASDSSSSKVAAVTSNGSAIYANVVTNGVELSTSGSELLGVIIDTDVYGGEGGEYLNSIGVVIDGTLYQLTNFYYVDDSGEYSETETNRAFFPVTRDSNSSSDSVTVRGEATTSTTATADDSLFYFVTETTTGLTIKETPEETNSSGSGETAAEE